jgi:hypothetical protein
MRRKPVDPEWTDNIILHGIKSLPVKLGRRTGAATVRKRVRVACNVRTPSVSAATAITTCEIDTEPRA